MEERSIWLPAGLESPRLEPDDRASHRSVAGNGKRRAAGPKAAAEGGRSDRRQDGQERGRAGSRSGRSEKPRQAKGDGRPAKPAAAGKQSRKQAKPKAEGKQSPRQGRPQGGRRKPQGGRRKPQGEHRRPQGEQHQPSAVDAMGQDKHREVVGQRYSLSRTRQFLYYGIFVAFVVAAYIGLKAAADSLDKAPAKDPDKAPWSKPGAPQGPLGGFEPPRPGNNGPTDFQ